MINLVIEMIFVVCGSDLEHLTQNMGRAELCSVLSCQKPPSPIKEGCLSESVKLDIFL